MDCWIASFPRSGNTYFRNILFYVYGIESSTWHKEKAYPVDSDYDKYRFVKTHLLPEDLLPNDPGIPGIYLVRDGRDAIVSIAHHKKDLVDPGSDFEHNLQEAIIAAAGSYFGGWSKNVNSWIQRAGLVIRFEDLIQDPVETFKRVENYIPLPPPDWSKLPAFKEMKSGNPKYGGTSKLNDPKFNPDEFAGKFFRKGKSGGWKEEMSKKFQELFWNYHGDTMERLGYETYPGSVGQNATLDYLVMKKMGLTIPQIQNEKLVVCIEASKLSETVNDGIKRYLLQMLKKFEEVTKIGDPRWEFKLLIGHVILPLESYGNLLVNERVEKLLFYEKILLGLKKGVRTILPSGTYSFLSNTYKNTGIRKILRFIQKNISAIQNTILGKKKFSLKGKADLLHIPLPQNAVHYKKLKHTMVVTVHDLTHRLFPDYHDSTNVEMSEEGMKFILAKKTELIVVSKSTIHDVATNYRIPADKMHLVYEYPDPDLFKMNMHKEPADIVRSKYKLGTKPYFLCLSTIEPRKNLPNTIRAFNEFCKENPTTEVNLVISGRYGWKTEHLSEELHLDNPRIIFTGYVDDNDLKVIYSEAIALCYVSFYEGFGLPPLEAMSCRTPVIYGKNSSMKEVIGDAGLPTEADNVNDIKEQMVKMFFDMGLRESMAELSIQRSFGFGWRRCIYDTLKVYEEVINKG